MFQILVDLHPEGFAIEHTENAKVIPFDPADPDAVQAAAQKAVAELVALVQSGWMPALSPAAEATRSEQEAVESDGDTGARTLRGPLPDDFPGKAALEQAGLDTYGKVRAYGDLTEVAGIGPATEAMIHQRLAEDAKVSA